jgi:putative (di)nucleoside polyphosphate hydrolase
MSLAIFDLDNTLLADDSDYLWGQFLVDQGIVDSSYYEQENNRFYKEYKEGNLDIYEFLKFSLKRANVGIILCNARGQVFWAKRARMNSWQFPQGGIENNENPEQAMYRELCEETGLKPEHVQILGRTRYWLKYKLPEKYIRRNSHPLCIGQKQVWYLLKLVGQEADVILDQHKKPEFDDWQWVEYWEPLKKQSQNCAKVRVIFGVL